MPEGYIRYPEKTAGTMGLFFKTLLLDKKDRLFCA
jgi:hypothetical protein